MRMIVVYALCLSFVLFSCIEPPVKNAANLAVKRTIRPEFAEGFVIEELSDSSFRITLLNLEKLPDTLQQIRWKPQTLNSIACLSTTHLPFIKALEQLPILKGTGFSDLVIDPEVRAMIDRGEVANLTVGHQLDEEKVFGTAPDLMFVYPYGGEAYAKFLDAGIGCVQISEYLEKSPLGRAEWIRLFGVLFDKEQQADSVFQNIKSAYQAEANLVLTSAAERPTVFTGSYDGGFWYMPPGNSFAARLIEDAGGHYVYVDSISSGNLVFPFEKILTDAHDCDFWGKIIYEKGPLTAEKLTEGDARLQGFKSFQSRSVFYCNAAETDYHGQAVLEPHLMLSDMIAVFHPEIHQQHAPAYFRKWE
jgi:iron complex transport system substrate-binding protein